MLHGKKFTICINAGEKLFFRFNSLTWIILGINHLRWKDVPDTSRCFLCQKRVVHVAGQLSREQKRWARTKRSFEVQFQIALHRMKLSIYKYTYSEIFVVYNTFYYNAGKSSNKFILFEALAWNRWVFYTL